MLWAMLPSGRWVMICTETASLGWMLVGTWAFTWNNPVYPGANPAKGTFALSPSTSTSMCAVAGTRALVGAGWPAFRLIPTGPKPVA